jgi:hypothetical protein
MPILDGISGLIDKLTGNAERKELERQADLKKQAQQARPVVQQREPQRVPVITPDRTALSTDRQENRGPAERAFPEYSGQIREAARNWNRETPEPVRVATELEPAPRPTWAPSPVPSLGGPNVISRTTQRARQGNQQHPQEPAPEPRPELDALEKVRAEQRARMEQIARATPQQLREQQQELDRDDSLGHDL